MTNAQESLLLEKIVLQLTISNKIWEEILQIAKRENKKNIEDME